MNTEFYKCGESRLSDCRASLDMHGFAVLDDACASYNRKLRAFQALAYGYGMSRPTGRCPYGAVKSVLFQNRV